MGLSSSDFHNSSCTFRNITPAYFGFVQKHLYIFSVLLGEELLPLNGFVLLMCSTSSVHGFLISFAISSLAVLYMCKVNVESLDLYLFIC